MFLSSSEEETDMLELDAQPVFESRDYYFVPLDKRLGWMFIKDIDQGTLKYIQEHNAQDTDYFVAKFLEWPAFSKNPWIKLDSSIGKRGNIEKECEALLRENDVIFF